MLAAGSLREDARYKCYNSSIAAVDRVRTRHVCMYVYIDIDIDIDIDIGRGSAESRPSAEVSLGFSRLLVPVLRLAVPLFAITRTCAAISLGRYLDEHGRAAQARHRRRLLGERAAVRRYVDHVGFERPPANERRVLGHVAVAWAQATGVRCLM